LSSESEDIFNWIECEIREHLRGEEMSSIHKLKSSERAKVRQFIQLTNCSEKIAMNCLAQNEWRLEMACDSFFTSPDLYLKIVDRKKIDNWFHKYSPNGDKILIDGCVQLLEDLNLRPNDRKVLILAHRLRAQNQCEFTKQEFTNGMIDMSCDSSAQLCQRLADYEAELTADLSKLRDLYLFAWTYGKHSDAKTMEFETAIEYWNILLTNCVNHELLGLWIEFVANSRKAVTKDTWNLLLEFATSVDSALSNYDFDGAWPTMIDDFVLWARDQLKAHNRPHLQPNQSLQ